MESIGTMAAGIAHDLNNILTPILLSADLLHEEERPDMRESLLANIEESAKRGANVISQVLTFARGSRGETSSMQLRQIVEEVEKIARETFPKNITVSNLVSRDFWPVKGNSTQIHQALLNLCINARDAMPDGGALVLSGTNEEIDEAFASKEQGAKPGQYAVLEVTDSGTGIPPEIISRIFDPFFTTKEVGKGTGLGLSLCYGLVKEHGGNITVTSQPGSGAVFTVELPATDDIGAADPATPVSSSPDNSQEGTGKKILLVDDEEMLLEMLRDGLKRHGYEVFTASNGEAALRELHAQKIDAICCDIKMPGLNGRQLYDWIRAGRPEFAHRIIFMTGDIINESLQMFLDQEHLLCLNKPFALDELRRTIQSLLAEK
jgi:CheY-like chemotaxis protein